MILALPSVIRMQFINVSYIWSHVVLLHLFVLLITAAGTASVYNNCGIHIYYKVISTFEQNYTVIPETGVQIPYSFPDVRVSIKLSLGNSLSPAALMLCRLISSDCSYLP